jgi:hypothetical protein
VTEALGVQPTGEREGADFWVCHGDGDDLPPHDRPYLPEHSIVDVAADVEVRYATSATPLMTTRARTLWWQPTDWSEPFNQFVPKYQVGSTYPVYRVAALINELAAETTQAHAVVAARPLPLAFHAWRSAGVDHVLLGNLETGEFGDSRVERAATIRLAVPELALGSAASHLELFDGNGPHHVELRPVEGNAGLVEAQVVLPPETGAVYRVR